MTTAELPLAMAIAIRWRSHAVSRLSPVTPVIRLPSSATNLRVEVPITPLVSTDRGSNR